jgi:hypothetical protein
MIEKAKPRWPSTFEGCPQHQNHAKMKVYILGDGLTMGSI